MTKKYLLQDLKCSGCASKIEKKISKIKGVNDANINLLFQKLTIEIEDSLESNIFDTIDKIVKTYEPHVKVVEL